MTDETPRPLPESGRNAANENFPVASRMLPAWARSHVMAFYAFARAADDVADTPMLSPQEKLELLALMEQGLKNSTSSIIEIQRLRESLAQTHVDVAHPMALLKAFQRDAANPAVENWYDLMAYCQLSAAPVGRYLIDLLGGGPKDDFKANDALCAALQVLNHLQDIKDDFDHLHRVYLPHDWLMEEGVAVADLGRPYATAELRAVIDRCLDGVDDLLAQSKGLPKQIRSRRLKREAAGIHLLAQRLSRELRRRDPLAERVELSKPSRIFWFLLGAVRG